MQSLCISMDCIGVLTKSQIPPIPGVHHREGAPPASWGGECQAAVWAFDPPPFSFSVRAWGSVEDLRGGSVAYGRCALGRPWAFSHAGPREPRDV